MFFADTAMGEKRKRKGAKKRIEVTQLLNKQAEESSKRDTFDGEVLDQVDKFDLEREVLYLDKDNERQNERLVDSLFRRYRRASFCTGIKVRNMENVLSTR